MKEFPETIWQIICADGTVMDLDEKQCSIIEKLLFNLECDYKPSIDIHGEMWYVGNEIFGNEIRVKLTNITCFNQSTVESREAYRTYRKQRKEENGDPWSEDE